VHLVDNYVLNVILANLTPSESELVYNASLHVQCAFHPDFQRWLDFYRASSMNPESKSDSQTPSKWPLPDAQALTSLAFLAPCLFSLKVILPFLPVIAAIPTFVKMYDQDDHALAHLIQFAMRAYYEAIVTRAGTNSSHSASVSALRYLEHTGMPLPSIESARSPSTGKVEWERPRAELFQTLKARLQDSNPRLAPSVWGILELDPASHSPTRLTARPAAIEAAEFLVSSLPSAVLTTLESESLVFFQQWTESPTPQPVQHHDEVHTPGKQTLETIASKIFQSSKWESDRKLFRALRYALVFVHDAISANAFQVYTCVPNPILLEAILKHDRLCQALIKTSPRNVPSSMVSESLSGSSPPWLTYDERILRFAGATLPTCTDKPADPLGNEFKDLVTTPRGPQGNQEAVRERNRRITQWCTAMREALAENATDVFDPKQYPETLVTMRKQASELTIEHDSVCLALELGLKDSPRLEPEHAEYLQSTELDRDIHEVLSSLSGQFEFAAAESGWHSICGVAVFPVLSMVEHNCLPNALLSSSPKLRLAGYPGLFLDPLMSIPVSTPYDHLLNPSTVYGNELFLSLDHPAPSEFRRMTGTPPLIPHSISSLVSTREISPGEPIATTYAALHQLSAQHRQAYLWASYGFTCACPACVAELKGASSASDSTKNVAKLGKLPLPLSNRFKHACIRKHISDLLTNTLVGKNGSNTTAKRDVLSGFLTSQAPNQVTMLSALQSVLKHRSVLFERDLALSFISLALASNEIVLKVSEQAKKEAVGLTPDLLRKDVKPQVETYLASLRGNRREHMWRRRLLLGHLLTAPSSIAETYLKSLTPIEVVQTSQANVQAQQARQARTHAVNAGFSMTFLSRCEALLSGSDAPSASAVSSNQSRANKHRDGLAREALQGLIVRALDGVAMGNETHDEEMEDKLALAAAMVEKVAEAEVLITTSTMMCLEFEACAFELRDEEDVHAHLTDFWTNLPLRRKVMESIYAYIAFSASTPMDAAKRVYLSLASELEFRRIAALDKASDGTLSSAAQAASELLDLPHLYHNPMERVRRFIPKALEAQNFVNLFPTLSASRAKTLIYVARAIQNEEEISLSNESKVDLRLLLEELAACTSEQKLQGDEAGLACLPEHGAQAKSNTADASPDERAISDDNMQLYEIPRKWEIQYCLTQIVHLVLWAEQHGKRRITDSVVQDWERDQYLSWISRIRQRNMPSLLDSATKDAQEETKAPSLSSHPIPFREHWLGHSDRMRLRTMIAKGVQLTIDPVHSNRGESLPSVEGTAANVAQLIEAYDARAIPLTIADPGSLLGHDLARIEHIRSLIEALPSPDLLSDRVLQRLNEVLDNLTMLRAHRNPTVTKTLADQCYQEVIIRLAQVRTQLGRILELLRLSIQESHALRAFLLTRVKKLLPLTSSLFTNTTTVSPKLGTVSSSSDGGTTLTANSISITTSVVSDHVAQYLHLASSQGPMITTSDANVKLSTFRVAYAGVMAVLSKRTSGPRSSRSGGESDDALGEFVGSLQGPVEHLLFDNLYLAFGAMCFDENGKCLGPRSQAIAREYLLNYKEQYEQGKVNSINEMKSLLTFMTEAM